MRRIVGICIVACMTVSVYAQEKISGAKLWKTLEAVTYEVTKDEYGDLYVPVFSKDIQKIQGKEVVVEGFIIPFEGMFKPTQLILSALPISECFFCGSGGPETVIEITMKEKIKYTTKRVKIRGKLKLNRDNPDKLMYMLEDGVFEGLADSSY